jgi:hypothetical protein
VQDARGDIAALSYSVRAHLSALRHGHLAFENDVRGFDCVLVVRIKGLWSILPDVRVQKSFLVELVFQRFLIDSHFRHLFIQELPSF